MFNLWFAYLCSAIHTGKSQTRRIYPTQPWHLRWKNSRKWISCTRKVPENIWQTRKLYSGAHNQRRCCAIDDYAKLRKTTKKETTEKRLSDINRSIAKLEREAKRLQYSLYSQPQGDDMGMPVNCQNLLFEIGYVNRFLYIMQKADGCAVRVDTWEKACHLGWQTDCG